MDLVVTDRVRIPESELEWRFTTSGGPGGQHANRSATRAEVRFDITASRALEEADRQRVVTRLGRDRLTVSADESRSQWRNRQLARSRLAEALRDALRPPAPERRATGATAAARRRRLEDKRRRSDLKRARRKPDWD